MLRQAECGYQHSLHQVQPAGAIRIGTVVSQAALSQAQQGGYDLRVLADLDPKVTQESAAEQEDIFDRLANGNVVIPVLVVVQV